MVHSKHVSHMLSRMRVRGWDEHSLKQAHDVLSVKKEPVFAINKFQEVLHWLVFLVIVIVNFLASAIIIPLLVIFPNPGLYAILMVMGVCFGLLFAVLLHDIQHMFNVVHHFTAALLIPTLAVINIFFIVSYFDFRYSNIFSETRHPVTMGLYYGVAFVLPYVALLAVSRLVRK